MSEDVIALSLVIAVLVVALVIQSIRLDNAEGEARNAREAARKMAQVAAMALDMNEATLSRWLSRRIPIETECGARLHQKAGTDLQVAE